MSEPGPGRLIVGAVRTLSPYVPGKPMTELERELGIPDIIKLASNENPWGPSPASLAAMHAAVEEAWVYPDGSGHELRTELARMHGVPVDCVTIGNGSSELLMLLAEVCLLPGLNAVYSQYGFGIYPLVIQATGAEVRRAPALPDNAPMPLGHDLAAMARLLDASTRLLFIANPNNPTGTWLESAALKKFIAAAGPDTLIVLDEAYYEYARDVAVADSIAWVRSHPNLIVLRTFSKAWGLAGARAGYAVSHPQVADALNRLRPAFNVSAIAQAGAAAAVRDPAHMEQCVVRTLVERRFLEAEFKSRQLQALPSAANFLLVRVGTQAASLYDALLRGGVIVRPVAGYGLPGYLRITVGTQAQNLRLLAVLDQHRGTLW